MNINTNLENLLFLVEEQQILIDRLEKLVYIDELTILKNRRAFDADIKTTKEKINRASIGNFVVAVLDIDDFKKVNDTYGHNIGDRALQLFSSVFKNYLRSVDLIYRWGGEEFVILFENTKFEDCISAIERCQDELKVKSIDQLNFKLTVSVGIKEYQYHNYKDFDPQDVFVEMKRAKEEGKNRICW